MSTGSKSDIDSEDYFADTRMSFGDHIEELRVHLWRAIIGFVIGVIVSFFFGAKIVEFIAAPVEQQLGEFYERRLETVKKDLKEGDPALQEMNKLRSADMYMARADWERLHQKKAPDEFVKTVSGEAMVVEPYKIKPVDIAAEISPALSKVGRRPTLSTLSVQEAFMVYFKVCMVAGLVLSSPWVFYQIWSFVAAGLYPHEKRYVNVFLPVSLGLFLLGVLVCQFLVIPAAIRALLAFNEWMNLEPDMRLNEWLGFAIMMPVVFGVSFQTPLVMLFLERVGIVEVETFKRGRRIAWFLLAIFAAVITPSVDALSMIYLWVPMCFLYELGIIMIRMSPPRPKWEDADEPESKELIEV
jgi:sec-independent protein translocase protein TatC